jgi:S-DNA-T family DNA segregation ATPase FtsK/SpoIIIE
MALEVEGLAPFEPDLREGPHFLVTGPVQSGKSTLLQSWALALAERLPPDQLKLYLVDFRQEALSPLQTLPHVQSYLTDDATLGAALTAIGAELKERRVAYVKARQPALVIIVDDLDALREGTTQSTRDQLEQLIRRERGLGFHLIIAGATSDFASGWDGLTKALKELQTGFLIGSSDHSDLQLFNLRLPAGEAGKMLPPGQGFYVRRGRFRRVKAATPHAGAVTLADWVERLVSRAHDLVR